MSHNSRTSALKIDISWDLWALQCWYLLWLCFWFISKGNYSYKMTHVYLLSEISLTSWSILDIWGVIIWLLIRLIIVWAILHHLIHLTTIIIIISILNQLNILIAQDGFLPPFSATWLADFDSQWEVLNRNENRFKSIIAVIQKHLNFLVLHSMDFQFMVPCNGTHHRRARFIKTKEIVEIVS